MLNFSDTNDSAESSKKTLSSCSYGHKSLFHFSAASEYFFYQHNFNPQKLHIEISFLLLSELIFLLYFLFLKFWLFLLNDPL